MRQLIVHESKIESANLILEFLGLFMTFHFFWAGSKIPFSHPGNSLFFPKSCFCGPGNETRGLVFNDKTARSQQSPSPKGPR